MYLTTALAKSSIPPHQTGGPGCVLGSQLGIAPAQQDGPPSDAPSSLCHVPRIQCSRGVFEKGAYPAAPDQIYFSLPAAPRNASLIREFALHSTYPGRVPGAPYVPLSLTRRNSRVWCQE